ncbi:MAG TPA: sensor histidine kinase [Treponema sp.]|nr:sensor histidine kinase [Treponema sp.]
MHYTLCDLFSDLTQNAVEAGANSVTIVLMETDQAISLKIQDNGHGMNPQQLAQATDPFWTDGIKHPGRKVGLGIPFLIQTAESTGGTWNIESNHTGKTGTTVTCSFDLTNIDTPPIGDVTGFFRQILSFDGRYEMDIDFSAERGEIKCSANVKRSELLEALGLEEAGSFEDAGSLALLGRYLESLMEEYYG